MDVNPFFYNRPASRSGEFVGRSKCLRTLATRSIDAQSTGIFGGRKAGKTSLLLALERSLQCETWFDSRSVHLIVCRIELGSIGAQHTPSHFWSDVCDCLEGQAEVAAAIKYELEAARQSDFSSSTLRRLFEAMHTHKLMLLLLLDDFDTLRVHSNYQGHEFFAELRSCGTTSGALALVATTRISGAAVSEWGERLSPHGSPLFNHLLYRRVPPFQESEIAQLLDRGGGRFSEVARSYVRCIAGRFPYLLQAAAHMLYESGPDDDLRMAESGTRFYREIGHRFFLDLWLDMPSEEDRTAALLLALVDLFGREAAVFVTDPEFRGAARLDLVLERLQQLGLVDVAGRGFWPCDVDRTLEWQGQHWCVEVRTFSWWALDTVILEDDRPARVDTWLRSRRYRDLLSPERWDDLIGVVRSSHPGRPRDIASLAADLAREVLAAKDHS